MDPEGGSRSCYSSPVFGGSAIYPGRGPPVAASVQPVSRKLAVHYTYQNSPISLEVFFVLDLVRSSVLGWCVWQGLKELAQLFLARLSWHTAKDVGVIVCCSVDTHLLPDQEGTRYVSCVQASRRARGEVGNFSV